MKAIRIHGYGGAEVLKYEEAEKPVPGANDVLIKVHASSINPIDIKICSGRKKNQLQLNFPVTPGYDVAGIVEDAGEGVKNVNVGDKVFGQAGIMAGASGAFAEYACTPGNFISRMPEEMSFTDAAASVLAGISAVQGIYDAMQLKPGQRVLIHGGSGGIGALAVQLAKNIGAYVASTAGAKGKDYVKKLGADEVIDYKGQKFEEILSGFDAVFDTVGGETYQNSFKVLKRGGIVVSMLEQPDISLTHRYGAMAQYIFTNTNTSTLDRLGKFIEEKHLKIPVDKVFPLDQVKNAFGYKEKEQVLGKIAIAMV